MKRVYVDTNVLLRFLTGDPPELASQAKMLFKSVEQGEVELVIDEIVVAEMVWVLQSFYGYTQQEIAQVLQELLNCDGLITEDKPGLLAALLLFSEKQVDFADAMVAVHMLQKEVPEIYSFDRHFDRLPGITRLLPG